MPSRNVATLPRWVVLLISLVPLVGVLAGAARVVKQVADARYVLTDQYALARRTDSLNAASDKRDVLRLLSGLDSSDRCRRGQSGFCR